MFTNSTNSPADRLRTDRNLYTGLLGFGLSQSVIDHYVNKGVTQLFDWQKECLRSSDMFSKHKNLVFSAPTSAGKSLVADIIIFQTLMRLKLKAIVVLPYVSIVQERVNSLKVLFRKVGLRMDAFAGNCNPRGGLDRTNVAVCTIEKANSLINRLIEEEKISQLGLVVVDELQMMGDPSRGYLIELILSKVNYIRKYLNHKVQVVGMSASLSNLSEIGDWLEGVTFTTNFRPVDFREYVVCNNQVYLVERNSNAKGLELIPDRYLNELQPMELTHEYSSLAFLTCETMAHENAVLIFCQTKALCETVATKLASSIRDIMAFKNCNFLTKFYQEHYRNTYIQQKKTIESLIATLKRTHAGLDANLEYLIQFGIGYHHAGLVTEQRVALEQAFRVGLIKVLFSTTTLSAGVNLPARRVMIVTPYDHANKILDISDYLQMIGRTGRKGFHEIGESFLFCLPKELADVRKMLASEPQPIDSSLKVFENAAQILESYERIQKKDKKFKFDVLKESNMINACINIMFRTVLEVLSNGLVVRLEDLLKYIDCTFLASKSSETSFRVSVLQTLHALIKTRLVEVKHQDFNIPVEQISPDLTLNMADRTRLSVTPFGKAVIASHIKPTDSNFILKELRKCQKNCCLCNDLHLIYETTPMNMVSKSLKIDWNAYYTIYRNLNEDMRHAADLIGIKEYFFIEMISGMNAPANDEILTTHKRFYVSLALYELVQEVPMNAVKNKFHINKGDLQSLQQHASSFAGMLAIFCNHMGWSTMEMLIDNFQPRLSFGVQRELIDLVRLPNISASIARQLYSYGFDTVIKLINCQPIDIAQVLVGKNSPLIKNDDRLTFCQTQLFGFQVYLSSSDKYMTIEEFSRKIIIDARLLVESDIGHPLNLEPISQDSLIPNDEQVAPPVGPFGLELELPVIRPGPYGTVRAYSSYCKPEITAESFLPQKLEALVPPKQSGSSQPIASGSRRPSGSKLRQVASQPERSSSRQQLWESRIPSKAQREQSPSSSSPGTSDQKQGSQRSSTPIKVDGSEKPRDVNLSMSMSFGDESLLEDVVRAQQQQQQQQQLQNNVEAPIPGPEQATSSNEALKRPLDTVDGHSLVASTREAVLKQSTSSSSSSFSSFSISTMSIDADENLSFGEDKSDSPGPSKTKIAKLSSKKDVHKEMVSSKEVKPSTSWQSDSSLETMDSSTLSQLDESSFFNYENVHNLLQFTGKEKKQNTNRMPMQFRNEPNVDKSNIRWVRANNVDECEKMLRNLFKKMGKSPRGKKIVHSVYFRLKPIPKNEPSEAAAEEEESGNINNDQEDEEDDLDDDSIENTHYFPLKNSNQAVYGVYIKRWGSPRVYWVYGKAALLYLCENWFPTVQDYVFRRYPFADLDQTDALKSRKLRIVTYDMKQTMHCLHEAFNFDRKLLFEQIDWWDADTALWLLDPESEKIDMDKISLSQLRTLMLKHGFEETQYDRIWDVNHKTVPRLICRNIRPKYSQIFDPVHRALKVMMLYNFLWLCLRTLNSVNLLDSYFMVEIPARVCVFIMETNPICVDVNYLKNLEDSLFEHLKIIENQIFRNTSSRFNIGDPKQVAQVLYSKCNLISNYFNVVSSPKAPRKVFSTIKAPIKLSKHLGTSKNSLMKLQDACGNRTRLPTMVIEWRKVDYSITNSVRAIRQHLNFYHDGGCQSSLLYSKFDEWTKTGRIVMHEPNLISFPKNFPLTTIQNTTDTLFVNREPVIVKVRKMLKSKEGHLFVAADYCQLELRIMAHLSQDSNLMNALKDIKKDIFKSIAADWKNISYEYVSNDERQQAKQVCYGIIYGMGDESLAEKLSMTLEEAKSLKIAFFERYPNVLQFIEDSIEKCARLGHVRTLMGRQRPIKNIDDDSKISEYNHACRQAVNTRIQGSAADLFKVAMINMQRKIFQYEWNEISLCLQMHDELVFQVPEQNRDEFAECLKETMQKISMLIDIPMPVKIFAGPNWSDLEELVVADRKESTPSHISETSDDDNDD